MTRERSLLWCLALGATFSAACSVINSFDDVAPGNPDASTGGSGGSGGTGADGGTAGTGAGGTGGTSGSGGTTGGGGSGGVGGSGGDGGTGGDAAVAGPGLIVVTGKVASTPVLSVISPVNGAELKRETGTEYAGVIYDRASKLFLLFEVQKQDGGPPQALKIVPRRFDKTSNTWDDAPGTAFPGAPLSAPGSTAFVGLNHRAAYLATIPADAGGGQGVVVINTTNPKALTLATQPLDETSSTAVDIVGSVTSAEGGSLAVMRQLCIPGTGCALLVGNITVNAGGISSESSVGGKGNYPQSASPGWGPGGDPTKASIAVAVPADPDGGTSAQVTLYTGVTFANGGSGTFPVQGTNRIAPLAFDRCWNVAMVGETTKERIHVVSIGSGTYSFVDKTFVVQRLLWEPHTRTVLAPFAQGGNAVIAAYRLTGTDAAPTLTEPPTWNPPNDIQAVGIAVEIDAPGCPP